MSEWERERNVECVVCPDCAFTFDAFHTKESGGYSCPLCAEIALREALTRIWRLQPTILKQLRDAGVVFDEKPHAMTPGDWQSIAFWIYTALCEAESIARSAL